MKANMRKEVSRMRYSCSIDKLYDELTVDNIDELLKSPVYSGDKIVGEIISVDAETMTMVIELYR